ncbi:hypothetical protein DNTS_004713, partial [Danionella cerebrum]
SQLIKDIESALKETHSDVKGGGHSSAPRSRNAVPKADECPHIGNYRLLKTIGKGNFAKVAVKIIDKTQLNSSSLQ